MNTAAKEGSPRLLELDGIRGLAILMVVGWHYVVGLQQENLAFDALSLLWKFLSISLSGVDLFLVLSGFLMGGLLRDDPRPHRLRDFYLRRFARLLPVYWLLLAVIFLIRHSPWIERLFWEGYFHGKMSLWWCVAFLQNHFYAGTNNDRPGGLFFTWYLPVLVQFYLVLPVLLRCIRPRHWLLAGLVLILSAPCFRLWLLSNEHHEMAAMVLLPSRFDSLFLGLFLAWLWRNQTTRDWLKARSRQVGWLCGFLLAACLLSAGWGLFQTIFDRFTWGVSLCALFYASLILWVLARGGTSRTAFFRNRALMGLGQISYGLYLFHQMVNFILHDFLLHRLPDVASLPQIGVTLLALALSIGLAALSWRFFEKPVARFLQDRLVRH